MGGDSYFINDISTIYELLKMLDVQMIWFKKKLKYNFELISKFFKFVKSFIIIK